MSAPKQSARAAEFNYLIGKALKEEIARGGTTAKAVSKLLDVEEAVMSRYLNGKRQIPITVFYDICSAVGGSPGEIVRRAAVAVDFPSALTQRQQGGSVAQQQQSYGAAAR